MISLTNDARKWLEQCNGLSILIGCLHRVTVQPSLFIGLFQRLVPVYMEWGTRSSGVGFFCFHALGDTKQKKPTPLDRGPPLHVNRPLVRPPNFPF